MQIERLDHLALTVADVDVTYAFYARVLGMQVISFGEGRHALGFGQQKINPHAAGREFEPKAQRPTPGSADLCLITATPLTQAEGRAGCRRREHRTGPDPAHRRHRAFAIGVPD